MNKNIKEKCIECGQLDLPTKSNKCRLCDPVTFYKADHYPAGKPSR